MTYCLAARLNTGLVFVADSRTNAGIDQLGVYSKMHPFLDLEGRFFTLLSAGNLATTQAVVARLHRDLREGAAKNLASFQRIRDAADYIGETSRQVQKLHAGNDGSDDFSPTADFIFGGQIGDAPTALFHIYPQGNYVAPTALAPFLQIGELKYGKPILDRIIRPDTELELAARCGLVSMDSTMRSNAGVGPPIELMMYRSDRRSPPVHRVFAEDDPYLKMIRDAWAENLRKAVAALPPIRLGESQVHLVDHRNKDG
jgi:putative proteasome-type protease